ncbi:MAG: imidazole glycerol phosphate synthase subunit HisF [Calditrichaeota bacterium]|nr:MAG: imidazole glycerol phosphate synthase subunit HisF [Calditrichota bacterium]
MLTHRIIPCLDIRAGRTVKGTHFKNLQDAGDPVELALRYCEQGADELTFLDITATQEARGTLTDLVRRVAEAVNIPFTVGGGIRTVRDVGRLLEAGADKVSVNSAAVRDPSLIDAIAAHFGSQCLVLAIDTQKVNGADRVFVSGGKQITERETTQWAAEAVERGVGEIMLTSIDHDGARNGFALDITGTLTARLSVPVIASGGAGRMEHFRDVFTIARAEAALAAGIFHFGDVALDTLKKWLHQNGVIVRL